MTAIARKDGVALLMVLFALAFMSVLSIEIIFTSRVDLRIGRNARDRIQAYYMAQSAARFSILRLYMYQQLYNLSKGTNKGVDLAALGIDTKLIDQVWSMPIPQLPLLGTKKTDWPGTISANITSEGSKIPINLLDGNKDRGSDDGKAKEVVDQLRSLIEGRLQEKEFDELYRGLKPEDLIYPLKDWIDADGNKQEGGDENSDYDRLDPPYKPRNDRIPNISELHLIKGWTDDLMNRFAANFSVINNGTTVNPNYISLDRIAALAAKAGAELTKEDLAKLEQRRRSNPFNSMDELKTYINSELRSAYQKFDLFDLKGDTGQTAFLIEASGVVGEARRILRLGVRVSREKKAAATGTNPSTPAPPPKTAAEDKTKLLIPEIVTVEEIL